MDFVESLCLAVAMVTTVKGRVGEYWLGVRGGHTDKESEGIWPTRKMNIIF